MKKLLFFFAIILFGISTKAQSDNTKSETHVQIIGSANNIEQPETTCNRTWKGMWLEPNLSFGLSMIFMNGENIPQVNAAAAGQGNIGVMQLPKLGYTAGCGLTFMFNEHFGLVTGLQIQQYGCHFTSDYAFSGMGQLAAAPNANASSAQDTSTIVDHSAEVDYTFTYAQIPILFRYVTDDPCHVSFFAEGGFLLGFLVNATESGTISQMVDQWTLVGGSSGFYQYANSSTSTVAPNTQPNVAGFDLGLAFTAGITIPLNAKMQLALALNNDWKLNSAGDGTKDVVSFGKNQYAYYGTGSYNGGFSLLLNARLLIYLGK